MLAVDVTILTAELAVDFLLAGDGLFLIIVLFIKINELQVVRRTIADIKQKATLMKFISTWKLRRARVPHGNRIVKYCYARFMSCICIGVAMKMPIFAKIPNFFIPLVSGCLLCACATAQGTASSGPGSINTRPLVLTAPTVVTTTSVTSTTLPARTASINPFNMVKQDKTSNGGSVGYPVTGTVIMPTSTTTTETANTTSTATGSTGSGTTAVGPVGAYPSSPAPVPVEMISGALTSVKIENTGGEQSNVPVTFGQVFAPGDVPAGSSVTGKLSDSTALPLQVNVKARHADGSIRHAIISAVLPRLAAGQTQLVGLMKMANAAEPQASTTPAALVNSGFSAGVNITLGGQVYSASADALLLGGTPTAWLAGPTVNEWLVSAPLKTLAGVAHPHLTARFAVRAYPGLNKAKVDVIIENNWAFEPGPQNFTYDAQVIVGSQSVYSKAALTHYHHARWRKTFWWGVAPQVHVRHNTAYLIASKALPNYDQSITISDAAISSMKSKFSGAAIEPMGPGLALPYMPNTGGRYDIGLLPGWSSMYLLSMDKRAKEVTLGTADLAGSWSSHYRNKITDRPVSLVDFPYMTILGRASDAMNPVTKKSEAFPACGGVCTNPNVADSAHQPAFSYLPYIVTGDFYHLEELQFWAMWNVFRSNPGYRENVKGLLYSDQIRAQGWSLRTLAEVAYITPDTDLLKTQFNYFLSNNLDWYNSTYTNNAGANKLGVLAHGPAFSYNNGTAIAPWQDDFFTSAVGHANELGHVRAKVLLDWKAKFSISRMAGNGFCWILGGIYNLKLRDTSSSPLYTTIGQTYQASNPDSLTSLACASAEMASNLGVKVGEMTGYASSNLGFPSNMQPALAYSVDSGSVNGANAWKIFMGRSVKPDYANGPQFAIVPR